MMCVGCITAANAQSSFTQKLQQSKSGEGKVTVTHSQNIDNLVNGQAVRKDSTSTKTVITPEEAKALIKGTATRDTSYNRDIIDPTPVDTSKKVIRGGLKVTGWRVQVFAGGNQRKDRQKAERIGNEIKALFPTQPVYVHFHSPRWICRMGNYRNYEDAIQMLNSVKKAGYNAATVIKEKITVYH
jgi:hypothetical protein